MINMDIAQRNLKPVKSDISSSVDFSVRKGLPLFKRQSYCIYKTEQFSEYAEHLLKLRARTARFSIPVITDSDKESEYTDYMSSLTGNHSSVGETLRRYTTPLWHLAYVTAAIDPGAKKKDPDNAHWYEPMYLIWNNAWSSCSRYMAKRNMRSFFEVWNEPDQPFWTKFNWDGYIRLYKNTARALRSGDPDAFVGGPAMSNLNNLGYENFIKFLDSTAANQIPLDFYSMHFYDNDPNGTMKSELDNVRKGLLSNDFYRSTQIIYTEFNIYTPEMGEWEIPFEKRTDFRLQSSSVVPKALSAIMDLNSYTDVTQVQWAWLLWGNGSFSLVDSCGNRTPLYHALYCYAHMPTDTNEVTNESSDVDIIASSDPACAAALLWNKSDANKNVTVNFNSISFDKYTITVYRIDKTHSSYYETNGTDELEAVESLENYTKSSFTWTGIIPALGTVYISITTENTQEFDKHTSVGTIVRCDNYFEDRTKNSYSDFDDLTSTATIGTGNNDLARGLVAVTYRNVKDKIKVCGALPFGKLKQLNNDSCLAVRVDYHTSSGYSKAVMYTILAPSNNERVYPWGTCKAPDVIKNADILDFEMDIKDNAPDGWDGQVIISFDIENTGKWTEAKFKMM